MKTRLGRWIIPVLGGIAFVYLLVPIAYIFAFSINDAGRTNLTWRGFTFSEMSFKFKVTPLAILLGLTFAALIGLLGGFLPAWAAARKGIVQAMREA